MDTTVLAMIMAGGNGQRLHPLTRDRAKPSVPFGGIYRLIDFTLSNCINSGLRKIVVLPQYKSLSLDRHLRLGWNILNPQLDEYIFSIPPQMRINGDWYKGTADSIYQNLYYADMVKPQYFLILSADHIYTMDYARMLSFHREKGADATVAAIEVDKSEAYKFGIIQEDKDYRITGFREKPQTIQHDQKALKANMGVYIFNADILKTFLTEDAHKESDHDFGKNIIPDIIPRARVFAYNYTDHNPSPYWKDVGSIDVYYETSMDLINCPHPPLNLDNQNWPIRTFQGQYPPARIVSSQEYPKGKPGICLDSLVSGGCFIAGGIVKHCILSPGVKINSHSQVEESIIMEGVEIGSHCKIKRAIIDKGVKIHRGTEIGYDWREDRKRYHVSDKGIVVIPKNTEISPARVTMEDERRGREVNYLQGSTSTLH